MNDYAQLVSAAKGSKPGPWWLSGDIGERVTGSIPNAEKNIIRIYL